MFLYDIDSIDSIYESKENNKLNVCYCRVFSTLQKEDLNRQISLIKEYALKNGNQIDEVFSDIGSEMSSDRTGLNQLIN